MRTSHGENGKTTVQKVDISTSVTGFDIQVNGDKFLAIYGTYIARHLRMLFLTWRLGFG